MGEQKSLLKGVASFFFGAPNKGSAKISKVDSSGKPKTAAQLRKERNDAKRAASDSVRYSGGNRKYILMGVTAIAAIAALSPIALAVSASKADEDKVRAIVKEELETSGRDFPVGQAVMWAGQVLRVWGTWDADTASAREVSIAPYLSSGMDPQAGWNASGKQEITYTSVNPDAKVIDANHAAVDAVYQIGDGSWRCVTIPVYAYKPDSFDTNSKWAFALAGNPTPTACSPRTGAPDVKTEVYAGGKNRAENNDLAGKLQSGFYPGFFSAWASSDPDALAQYTASGVKTTGLGGAMASNPQPRIGKVRIWTGKDGEVKDGTVYNALVTVTWAVTGSTSRLSAEYLVPMKRQGERWFVAGEPVASQQATDVQGGGPATIPEPGDDVKESKYPSVQETETLKPGEVTPTDSSTGGTGNG